MEPFLAILFFYFLAVGVSYKVGNSAMAAVDGHLSKNQIQAAVSVAWAWLDERSVEELIYKWGSQELGKMHRYLPSRREKLIRPHVAFSVALTLLYQTYLRKGGPFATGDCMATPNCSNFFVGCLLRYPFFEACARGYLRVVNCDATQPISFSEGFRD